MGQSLWVAYLWAALPVWAQTPQIRLTQIVGGISAPTDIQNAGDGSNRLFLVQQNGIVRLFKNGQLLNTPFLDIDAKTNGDGERGLLGLAFPPRFAEKQRFYVNYTNLSGNTVIAMYSVSQGNPDVAIAGSEQILLTIPQPYSNHNGGALRFGPDGFLYIAMGDGGSGGDPQGFAQNPQSLLGKMVRLDVESQPGTARIPPSNPFANSATTRPEIWALGFRNPWRFSFDRATGDIWIGDVGQGAWEEIDYQPAASTGGENYGWNRMEGAHCYGAQSCNQQGLTLPVAEYANSGQECSVTGGHVYRGSAYPSLAGTYFYGDYCSGRIWSLRRQNGQWVNQPALQSGLRIRTFGEDEAGEVYVADGVAGGIHRIEPITIPVDHNVQISSTPAGQPFTVNETSTVLTAPRTITALGALTITWQSPTTSNGTRQTFREWADGSTANPRTFLINDTSAFEGVFTTAYQIGRNITGTGTVTLNPAPADGYYNQGAAISVQAIPGSGYRFAGYSGCLTSAATNANVVAVQPCTVNALFLPEEIPPPTGLRFVPVTLCRVMDTRDPLRTGAFGMPALEAGTTRTLRAPDSPCGIPASAKAYVLNVTVAPRGPLSFLTIWPSDKARPLASTVNSPAGAIVANMAIVAAAANSDISVYVTDATHVVLDIAGYFLD